MKNRFNENEDLLPDDIVNDLTINDFWGLISRRKKLFYSILGLVFSSGIIYTTYKYIFHPKYEGSFVLMISNPFSRVDKSELNFFGLIPQLYNDDIPTLLEFLQSAEVIKQISDKYNYKTLKQFRKNLSLSSGGNIKKSAKGIIKVKFRSDKLEKNNNILIDLGQKYLDVSMKIEQERLLKGTEFLNREVPKYRNSLVEIEEKIQKLRSDNKSLIPFQEDMARSSSYAKLENELIKARSIYKSDSNFLKSLENQLAQFKNNNIKRSLFYKEYELLERERSIANQSLAEIIKLETNFKLQSALESPPWKIITPVNTLLKPVSPNIPQNILLSFVMGILFGGIAIFTRDRLDYVFISADDISKTLDLNPLARIPYINFLKNLDSDNQLRSYLNFKGFSEKNNLKFLGLKDQFSLQESFRTLVTSLRYLDLDNNLRSISITSSVPSEGKTSTNILLAKTLSELGKKVLLIDVDMRRPKVHEILNVNNIRGLSTLITNKKLIYKDVIQDIPTIENLKIITAGLEPPNTDKILTSERFKEILKDLKDSDFDYLLFDAPPMLGMSDAILLSENLDGLILLVSVGKVNRDIPKETIRKINQSKVNFLGVITNLHRKEFTSKKEKDQNSYYKNYYSDDPISKDNKNIEISESNSNKIKSSIFNNILKIQKTLQRLFNWIDK